MSKNKTISHQATVLFVQENRIDVQMTIEGACTACHARKACGMDESEDRVLSLHTESAGHYSEGEQVNVFIEERMGIKAAVYAYIFPFFIMIAVLLLLFGMGFSDLVAGISSLVALVVYWGGLYFFRDRIEKEIVFKLEKI